MVECKLVFSTDDLSPGLVAAAFLSCFPVLEKLDLEFRPHNGTAAVSFDFLSSVPASLKPLSIANRCGKLPVKELLRIFQPPLSLSLTHLSVSSGFAEPVDSLTKSIFVVPCAFLPKLTQSVLVVF